MFVFAVFILAAVIYGCATENKTQHTENVSAELLGFKLWNENCSRCHNIPSPAAYSDENWEVIGAHMRVRGYLTKKETEEIIGFLKTIN